MSPDQLHALSPGDHLIAADLASNGPALAAYVGPLDAAGAEPLAHVRPYMGGGKWAAPVIVAAVMCHAVPLGLDVERAAEPTPHLSLINDPRLDPALDALIDEAFAEAGRDAAAGRSTEVSVHVRQPIADFAAAG